MNNDIVYVVGKEGLDVRTRPESNPPVKDVLWASRVRYAWPIKLAYRAVEMTGEGGEDSADGRCVAKSRLRRWGGS